VPEETKVSEKEFSNCGSSVDLFAAKELPTVNGWDKSQHLVQFGVVGIIKCAQPEPWSKRILDISKTSLKSY